MGYRIVKLIEAESRMAFVRGWGEEEEEKCWSKGTKFQLYRISSGDLMYSLVSGANSMYCIYKIGYRVDLILSVLITHTIIMIKGCEGTLGGDGNVNGLDDSDGFMVIYFSPNS